MKNEQKIKQEFESYKKKYPNTEGFFDVLERFRKEKKMKACDLYRKADITKAYYYKLRGNKHPNIAKEKVVAFGLALQLNKQEMDELLLSAGFALSKYSKFDIAVMFCIEHKRYNKDEIQELSLEKYRKEVYTRKTGTEADETEDTKDPESDSNSERLVNILNNLAERLDDFTEGLTDTEEGSIRSEGLEEGEVVQAIITPIVKVLDDLINETTKKIMDIRGGKNV
jgi:DNA repair exonuclease SbcCD nuclease subunit